jgi:hypothetical protein
MKLWVLPSTMTDEMISRRHGKKTLITILAIYRHADGLGTSARSPHPRHEIVLLEKPMAQSSGIKLMHYIVLNVCRYRIFPVDLHKSSDSFICRPKREYSKHGDPCVQGRAKSFWAPFPISTIHWYTRPGF